MTPDAIQPTVMRIAVNSVRDAEIPQEIDDELLASLIEHGIDAVPIARRAHLLRAIGHSPEIAAVVAELAPGTARERASSVGTLLLGLRHRTWRMAWAACAALALCATLWQPTAPVLPAPAEITVLDGGVDGPAHDFADSLHDVLRRQTAVMLWALLTLLTVPALMTYRHPRSAASASVGD